MNVTVPKSAKGMSWLLLSKSYCACLVSQTQRRLLGTDPHLDDPLRIRLAQRSSAALIGERVRHLVAGGQVLDGGGPAGGAVGVHASLDAIARRDIEVVEVVGVVGVPLVPRIVRSFTVLNDEFDTRLEDS